jgi:CheY-like chemotaxis protein
VVLWTKAFLNPKVLFMPNFFSSKSTPKTQAPTNAAPPDATSPVTASPVKGFPAKLVAKPASKPAPKPDLPRHSFGVAPAFGTSHLPLQGMTILVVEDSRFACEALRLMCQRGGARMRRAENLHSARAHLRVYIPDVLLVDLGLPDGRGESLIQAMVLSEKRPQLLLATSGHPEGRVSAMAAGADDFLDKPLQSLAILYEKLRMHLPDLAPNDLPEQSIRPDKLALQDDLARAREALRTPPSPSLQGYVGRFVLGLAADARDAPLGDAARMALRPDGTIAPLQTLLQTRLKETATDKLPQSF